MKHLKKSMMLLLTVAIFTSCEKETLQIENSQNNTKETKVIGSNIPFPLQEIMNTGNLLGASFEKIQSHSKMASQNDAKRVYNIDVTLFDSKEDFNNNTLPTEDFENVITDDYSSWGNEDYFTDVYYTYSFPSVLNENNLYGKFNEGDFTSGISFELELNQDNLSNSYFREEYSDEELEEMMYDSGWYIQDYNVTDFLNPENNFTYTKQLFTNFDYTSIVLKFTENSVNSVSFDAPYAWNTIFKVYDTEGNLIVTDNTQNYNYYGYWGVTSKVSIGKIVISYFDALYFRLDNVSFGNNPDFDDDGILNENDAHPNSDFSKSINIAGHRLKIINKMVKNGSTMMDQLNDLIAQTNAQYNGENYDYHHKRFMTELSQLTYKWRMARLITATQRSQISSIAWGATIPYMYN